METYTLSQDFSTLTEIYVASLSKPTDAAAAAVPHLSYCPPASSRLSAHQKEHTAEIYNNKSTAYSTLTSLPRLMRRTHTHSMTA